MKRLSNQVRQRRRQKWLDIPAHGIEEAGHGKAKAIGKLLQETDRDSRDQIVLPEEGPP